jgi:hypothetical protein
VVNRDWSKSLWHGIDRTAHVMQDTAAGVSLSAGETMASISSPGKMDQMTMLPAVSGFEDFIEQTF